MAVVPKDSEAFPDGIAKKGSTDYADNLEGVTINYTKLDADGKPLTGEDGKPKVATQPYGKGEVHVIVSPQDKTKPYECRPAAASRTNRTCTSCPTGSAASSSCSCC